MDPNAQITNNGTGGTTKTPAQQPTVQQAVQQQQGQAGQSGSAQVGNVSTPSDWEAQARIGYYHEQEGADYDL